MIGHDLHGPARKFASRVTTAACAAALVTKSTEAQTVTVNTVAIVIAGGYPIVRGALCGEAAIILYMFLTFTRLPTPIGELVLTASDTALTGVYFPTSRRGPAPTHQAGWVEAKEGPAAEVLARARQQLEEYFARTRTTFALPLEAVGSAFEHRVWNALRQIPYGATTSYGALAKQLGDRYATRAVGLANGKNPIPIIVPCHRVVGSKGELTGFGGGLDTKRWLLDHEGAQISAL